MCTADTQCLKQVLQSIFKTGERRLPLQSRLKAHAGCQFIDTEASGLRAVR